jgi:hypothetical protein
MTARTPAVIRGAVNGRGAPDAGTPHRKSMRNGCGATASSPRPGPIRRGLLLSGCGDV